MKIAIRQLLKNPGFAGVAILILTLGIGANTTMFTLVNAFLLKPVAGRDPDRLVGVYSQDIQRPGHYRAFSYPEYLDLKAERQVFEDVYAFSPGNVGVRAGDATRRVNSLNVSANFFSVFGVPLHLGREFFPEDEAKGSPVVIVSHRWWKQQGAREDMVGSVVHVNGRAFTVIGVASPEFTGIVPSFPPDVFLPLFFDGTGLERITDRSRREFMLVGRLKAGVPMETAGRHLDAVTKSLAERYPSENRDQQLQVARLPRMAISNNPMDDRTRLRGLSLLVLCMAASVLLICCLNLANLMLARGTARAREIAIRTALGASRRDILGQVIAEGFLLVLLGSVLSLVGSYFLCNWLVDGLNSITPERVELDVRPDWRVGLFNLFFSGLALLLFSVGPGLKLARSGFMTGLKQQPGEGLNAGESGVFNQRNLLVFAQIALSLALLVAAGLFTRSAIQTVRIDPGFNTDSGFYIQLDSGLTGMPRARARVAFQDLLGNVRNIPGIESAALAATIPLGKLSMGESVQRAGAPHPAPLGTRSPSEGLAVGGAHYNVVSEDYFRTLGTGLKLGRDFESGEFSDPDRSNVAIINTVLAEALWPGENPVGRSIQMGNTQAGAGNTRIYEIVGVSESHRAQLSDQKHPPMAFVPCSADLREEMTLHVRTAPGSDPSSLIGAVREEIRRAAPDLSILAAKTMRQHLDTNVHVWVVRAGAGLLAGLGLVAVLLAVVGIYGVKSFQVARRSREIGIRIALGANRSSVVGLMIRDGAGVLAAGLVLGMVLATGLAAAARGFLFEVKAFDPMTFAICPLLLLVPALLASWIPARRAASVDPMIALRQE